MNSSLVNIWREVGAYLRFADAKNGIVFGVSAATSSSYYGYVYIEEGVSWNLVAILGVKHAAATEFLALALFCIATLISGMSVFPTLSKQNLRIRIFNVIGRALRILKNNVGSDQSAFFFSDIAAFDSHQSYENKLIEKSVISREVSKGESDIIEQILVLSKIASAKYVQFVVATVSVTIGAVVALFL